MEYCVGGNGLEVEKVGVQVMCESSYDIAVDVEVG